MIFYVWFMPLMYILHKKLYIISCIQAGKRKFCSDEIGRVLLYLGKTIALLSKIWFTMSMRPCYLNVTQIFMVTKVLTLSCVSIVYVYYCSSAHLRLANKADAWTIDKHSRLMKTSKRSLTNQTFSAFFLKTHPRSTFIIRSLVGKKSKSKRTRPRP